MEIVHLIRDIAVLFFCILACLFAIAGTAAQLRFPDTYTRLHGAGLGSTAACFSVFLAALISAGSAAAAVRILLIVFFFLISSPTTTHIIARYAWQSGLDPWWPPREKAAATVYKILHAKDGQPGRGGAADTRAGDTGPGGEQPGDELAGDGQAPHKDTGLPRDAGLPKEAL